MTYTVLPPAGCGDLFQTPALGSGFLHACAWTIPCHNLRSARFFLSPSQQCPTALGELISALSKCSQAQERHTRVMLNLSAGQELLWAVGVLECQISAHQPGLQPPLTYGSYEEPYLHTGRSTPGLSIPLLELGCDLDWDSWHFQALSLCVFCSWFWSWDCSKWTDSVWTWGNERFFQHLRL